MGEIKAQQILVPKKVYIGDSAELRINFSSQLEITNFNWISDTNLKDYTIQDVKILHSGIDYYQLSIYFVPWKTGEINLPDLELFSQTSANETSPSPDSIKIETEPVQIVSLVEQNQVNGIRSQNNPLLLPGTAYKLYGTLLGLCLVMIIILRLIIKRKKVALFIKNVQLKHKYKKNKKKTLKILSKLDKSLSHKEIAEIIQKTMRNYLEIRFEHPFSNVVSSKITEAFTEATCELASPEKMEAAEEIAGIFTRTDYIRYANAEFQSEEIDQLVEKLSESITILEAVPPKEIDIH